MKIKQISVVQRQRKFISGLRTGTNTKKKGQPENTEKWTSHRKMFSIQIMKVLLVKDAFDQFNIKYH